MDKIKIPVLISKISRLQKKYLNDSLKNFNLESSQGIILLKIKELENTTPTQLVELGVVEKPAVSKTLKKLEGLGYITKSPSHNDARSFFVSLTHLGKQAVDCIKEFVDDLDEEYQIILNKNSTNELNKILDFLEKKK